MKLPYCEKIEKEIQYLRPPTPPQKKKLTLTLTQKVQCISFCKPVHAPPRFQKYVLPLAAVHQAHPHCCNLPSIEHLLPRPKQQKLRKLNRCSAPGRPKCTFCHGCQGMVVQHGQFSNSNTSVAL